MCVHATISLAYHFRCAGNCREEACKYAVKAADYALSRGAFNDGLTFAVAAVECATSRGELRLLLQVIDQAIVELGDGEALVVVMDGDDECWTFRSLGEQIRLELDKLKALRKASMQTMVVDTDTAQSLHSPVDSLGTATNQSSPLSPIHLSWKPSYSNLAKSRTATSEDRLPSADILVGDCQGVCCVIS